MRQHHAQILFRYIVLQVLVGINIGEVFRDKSSKWGMGGGGGGVAKGVWEGSFLLTAAKVSKAQPTLHNFLFFSFFYGSSVSQVF